METKEIKYQFTDTGHWLARCNHQTNVIELNRREFPRLSPMMRDYVWCHEYAHLLYDVYDENECNRIADAIFLSRATTPEEKRRRREFIANSEGSVYSGIAVTTILTAASLAVDLGIKAYKIFNTAKDTGYYSLTATERGELLTGLIDASFKEASSGGKSAKQIFWGYISQCPGVESGYDAFISNPENYQARSYIAKCAAKYGFGFDTVLPVDWLAKPWVRIGLVALAVLVLAIVIIKKYRK